MLSFKLNLSKSKQEILLNKLEQSRKNGDLREYTRIASILSFAEGYSVNQVAEIFRVTIGAVYKWLKNYIAYGLSGIIDKKIPGRPSKLTKKQRRKLANLIDKGPEAYGFTSACWRSPMIQEIILVEFGKFYSARYLSQLLKNMGYSYQKAAFVAAKQDEEKRAAWLADIWPSILKRAKDKKGYILFGDEASFPQWGTLSYTWARKGKQPLIKTSGNRRSYKVFGLIDYFSGRFFAKGRDGKLNSDSYIDFLKGVLTKTRKHIFLVQDGAPYHKGKKVKEFFAKHADRITVYTLPSYSPDFNPIEKLWKKIKQHGTHLKYFPTFEDLTNKVEDLLIDFKYAANEVLALFGFYQKTETI
jgi:transposase